MTILKNWARKLLRQEIAFMKQEIQRLKHEILLKQEHINKTNAYWKKQMSQRNYRPKRAS